jgi:hypothetical protein
VIRSVAQLLQTPAAQSRLSSLLAVQSGEVGFLTDVPRLFDRKSIKTGIAIFFHHVVVAPSCFGFFVPSSLYYCLWKINVQFMGCKFVLKSQNYLRE